MKNSPLTKQVVKSWIGREGFPRVKFAGVAEPHNVRKVLARGDSNTKTRKNSKLEYHTRALSLSPHNESGVGNTCPDASTGCAAACLDHQGLASVFAMIRRARVARTVAWYNHREWFLNQLNHELDCAAKLGERKNENVAIRLNVFSDIPWERYGVIDRHPTIQFYDYTKNPKRAGQLRPNYWVTFSRSESNEEQCKQVLRDGDNVAIAFADPEGMTGNRAQFQRLPQTWQGFRVVDGDDTDLRFLDPRGVVVGLRIKAHSNEERVGAIESGFAVKMRARNNVE